MLGDITKEIAQVLGKRVRVLTTDQIARHFYTAMKDPKECANRAARTLVREGFAVSSRASVRHLRMEMPLATWAPNNSESPAFKSIAWANKKRWEASATKRSTCLYATAKGAAQCGSKRRVPRTLELEHDIAVAEVYLTLTRNSPLIARTWILEDDQPIAGPGDKRADAVVTTTTGAVQIELVGSSYSRKKLENLWTHFRHQHVEFW